MESVKKVIYISWVSLTLKLETDWYMSYLISKKMEVKFWDLTGIYSNKQHPANILKRDYVEPIKNFRQFGKKLKEIRDENAVYIILINYGGRFNRIFRLLKKYDCRSYYLGWGNFPFPQNKYSKKILRLLRHPISSIRIILEILIAKFSIKFSLVKPYDVIFFAGYYSYNMYSNMFSNRCKKIPINLIDYDKYSLLLNKKKRIIKERYCLFLDINLPYHGDIPINRLSYIKPGPYYQSLNKCFEQVESEYGIQVVIAAHPGSQYNHDLFKERKVLKGVTHELVKDCDFVISHNSTSISYAVLNEKPVILIYTDEMARKYRDYIIPLMHNMAVHLDAAIYNIDQSKDDQEIKYNKVNKRKYNNYKYEFLTTRESEDQLTRDIFYKEITSS